MRRRSFAPLALGALLALLGLGVPVAPASAQSIPVRVGGEASSFVGLEVTLPIDVDMSARTEKLGAIALRLQWNPLVLQFLDGSNGAFGDVQTNEDSTVAGVLRLVSVNPVGLGGRFVLGVGRFKPLAADTTTLALSVTELYAAGTFVDLLPDVVVTGRQYCPAIGRYADVDADKTASSRDALLALSHAVGRDISGLGSPALGDVDGDGLTGARDALIILSAAVGLDVSAFRVMRIAPGPCGTGRRPALAVTPSSVTLDLGQLVRVIAVAADSSGAGLATTEVLWSTSDPQVATVDPDGRVTGVGLGTATITAARLGGGPSATATVTVSRRRVHWVDGFAFSGREDQVGSAELPFSTIQAAVDFARPGDTVRVRSGRYAEQVSVTKPIVIEGDTAGGRARPLIAAAGQTIPAFTIETGGRVELHRLRVDTLYRAIQVYDVDTLRLRHMDLRASCTGATAVDVDRAGTLFVERSVLLGSGGTYELQCYSNNGIYLEDGGTLTVDSSVIADFRDDGVYLNRLDSLFVRGSQIRNNYGYGIYHYCYGCGRNIAMVFTQNRMTQNEYGHVYSYDYYYYYEDYGSGVRSARFDHNVWVGGGYDAITLYGDTLVTDVSMVGDTFEIRDGGWLNLYRFDSLLVDSVLVNKMDDYSYIEGGRIAVIRNSKFLELTGNAMYMGAYPRDTMHIVVRNVDFRGPDSTTCDRCGSAFGVNDRLSMDIQNVTGFNLNDGFYIYDANVTARDVSFQHVWDGIYVYCGSLKLTKATFTDVYYPVDAYGCIGSDSLVVDSTSITDAYYAIETDDLHVVVTNSSFQDVQYETLYHDCGTVRWISNTVTNAPAAGDGEGIYAYGCAATDSLIVKHSSFTGVTDCAVCAYGMPAVVDSNSFTDSRDNPDLSYASAIVRDNVILRPVDGDGIDVYSNGDGDAQVLRNTVTCVAPITSNDAVYVRVSGAADSGLVAYNVVTGCAGSGVWADAYSGALAQILQNTVTLADTAQYGIRVGGNTPSRVRVAGNTVTGKARYGSIRLESSMARVEVDSNTVAGAIEAGIYAYGYADTLTIRDNTIAGVRDAACCTYTTVGGVVLAGALPTNVMAHVLRNRITDSRGNGIAVLRYYGTADTVTVRVDSNVVRHVDSMGVWVRYYSLASIRKNAIDSAGIDGVRLSDSYRGVAPAVLDSNNLTRSVQYGLRNLSGYVVDATDNWWNSPLGPRCVGCDTASTGDSVSTNVTFAPFLTSPAGAPAPAPVFVAARWPGAARAWTASVPVVAQQRQERRMARAVRPARVAPAPAERPTAFELRPPLARAPAPGGLVDPLVEADRRQAEQLSAQLAERRARMAERATALAEREARVAERRALRDARRAEAERRRTAEGRPR